jgi:recombination protein RecA
MARKKKNVTDVQEATEDLKKLLDHDEIVEVEEFIPTGSTLLDYAISNRKNGGIPVGRITELIGENQAGKTLIATHILANTQKMGGIAVCIDVEHDMDKEFSARVGLKWGDGPGSMIYKEYLESIEEVFEYIEKLVITTRARYKDVLIAIVWDSVGATKARAEQEGGFEPAKYMGLHARLMSQGLRKIRSMIKSERIALVCTNQVREKIGVMFGDPTTTSHGKALSFYSSVRVKLARTGAIKSGSRILGAMCQAKVIKNKVGPGWRVVDVPILYDWGIDDYKSILDYLMDLKVVTGTAWKTIVVDGEEIKFQNSGWHELVRTNEKVRKFILDKVDEDMIIKFDRRPEDLNIDPDSIMEVEQVKSDLESGS